MSRLLFKQPPLTGREIRIVAVTGLLLAAAALAPGLLSSYGVSVVRDALIFSVFALSLDFLWGKAGVLSLGHAVNFGLGAYGYAIAMTKLQWTAAAGLALGIGAASLVAAIVGYFLIYAGVRLHFFAIITMALGLIAGQIAVSWASVTGGDVGILGVPGLRFGPIDLRGEQSAFYVAFGLLCVVLSGLWLACRGNYGKVLAAVAMNEFRARTLGYDTSMYLLVAFVVSAALAATAGAAFAAVSGVVAPDLFSVLVSLEVLVWVAVGGRGSLLGAVAATFLITRLQAELSSFSTSLWPLVLGTIFVLQVLFLPKGLADLVRSPRTRLLRNLLRRKTA